MFEKESFCVKMYANEENQFFSNSRCVWDREGVEEMEKKGKCILVCAGELELETIPVEEGDFVIAVDGGMDHCAALRIEPDLILGDFDSVGEREREKIAALEGQGRRRPDGVSREEGAVRHLPGGRTSVRRLPREKDDTDTMAALKEGLRLGHSEFCIYGGMGGRFDHALANVQALLFLRNHGARGRLAGSEGEVHVIKNEKIRFGKDVRGILSLFSLVEESRGVTIEGMKYLLDRATVRNDFPIGISNEFIGEGASVTVEDGALACIILYEKKESGASQVGSE